MATARSKSELFKLIQQKANKVLQTKVNEAARRTLKENVITEVYDKYTPSQYERTGGLLQDSNIETVIEKDNTISVRSTRKDDGKDIAEIIETGMGYTWETSEIYQMQPYPRPFHAETASELLKKGIAKEAMRKGLLAEGLEVK